MKKIAEVFLRESNEIKTVPVSSDDKPEISKDVIEKWQHIIDIISKVLGVPSALLMHITEESMIVYLKNKNENNPYVRGKGDKLRKGLYCESVIGRDAPLEVENALNHEKWKDNPDVKLNMISYYGLPIKWPDDEYFGTLCVLDSEAKTYDDTHKELMEALKEAIESDLKLLLYRDELKYYAEMDTLTETFNRHKIENILKENFERFKRYNNPYAVSIMDIDGLKRINDTYGHLKGDAVIQTFAREVNQRIRSVDSFGRWGGDEFLLICPETDIRGIHQLLESIESKVLQGINEVIPNIGFSYGIAEISEKDQNYQKVLKRADDRMYKEKEQKSNTRS